MSSASPFINTPKLLSRMQPLMYSMHSMFLVLSTHTHERLQILCYILKWWYALKGYAPKINNAPGHELADTMLGKQKQQLNSCKHQPHKQPKLRCKHAYLLCGNRFMLVRWGGRQHWRGNCQSWYPQVQCRWSHPSFEKNTSYCNNEVTAANVSSDEP